MFEEYFVCSWDLFTEIPSLRDPSKTLLDEFRAFNQTFTSESHCRLLRHGEKVDVASYELGSKDQFGMSKLLFTSATLPIAEGW